MIEDARGLPYRGINHGFWSPGVFMKKQHYFKLSKHLLQGLLEEILNDKKTSLESGPLARAPILNGC